MEKKFSIHAPVRGRANTEDEGKTGLIVEKGKWINHFAKPAKPPSDIWFVLWNGETEKKLKREEDLETIG